MERLTARSPKNGMTYLVKIKPEEQAADGTYDTLMCIREAFDRLAEYEESGLQSQLAEAQASITQLGISLVQEREKSAEAQADNAMLVKAHEEIKWLTNNRREEIRRLMNGPMSLNSEQADYTVGQGIADWENVYNQPHPGASLLQELEQLRKVRDAAEKAIYTKSQVGKTRYEYDFSKALCQVQLALAQAKGAE